MLEIPHTLLIAQTFVSDILVAVNPFKKLPIYGKEVCYP